VLVRWLIALLAVPVLLIAGCGGSSDDASTPKNSVVLDDEGTPTAIVKPGSTREISGPWAGKLRQSGLAPFRVAVVIFNGTGRVAYTGIDCAGDWKLAGGGDPGPAYVFRETINEGAGGVCKGTGTVHLENFASKRLHYRFDGGGVTSQGILRPARTRVWAAIFREAGVQMGTGTSEPCPKGAQVCGATATAAPAGGMSK
jgi:hypothetical protein